MDENLQKEQFSAAYLRAVCAVAGYCVTKPEIDDDSVDFTISSSGMNGTTRRPKLDLQLKCTAKEVVKEDGIHFPLDAKNFDDLSADALVPRILVTVAVPAVVGDWIRQDEQELALRRCGYWMSLRGHPDRAGRGSVTVVLPRTQVMTPESLASIMQRINQGGQP